MDKVDDCNKDFDIFQNFISPTIPKQVKMADKIQRIFGGIAEGEQRHVIFLFPGVIIPSA